MLNVFEVNCQDRVTFFKVLLVFLLLNLNIPANKLCNNCVFLSFFGYKQT